MKGIVIAAVAALSIGGVVSYQMLVQVPEDTFVAVAEAGYPIPAETFQLRSNEVTHTCAVTRGQELSAGRAELKVDPSCAAVLPGVEKAKYWVDKTDGSVAFTADGVDPIVTFAVADGVAYESLQPAQPVISLDAQTGGEAEDAPTE